MKLGMHNRIIAKRVVKTLGKIGAHNLTLGATSTRNVNQELTQSFL